MVGVSTCWTQVLLSKGALVAGVSSSTSVVSGGRGDGLCWASHVRATAAGRLMAVFLRRHQVKTCVSLQGLSHSYLFLVGNWWQRSGLLGMVARPQAEHGRHAIHWRLGAVGDDGLGVIIGPGTIPGSQGYSPAMPGYAT